MDGYDSSWDQKEEQSKCVWIVDGSIAWWGIRCDRLPTLSKLNDSKLLVGSPLSRSRMRVAVLNIRWIRLL